MAQAGSSVVLGFDILCRIFLSIGTNHIFGQIILALKNQFIFLDTVAWTSVPAWSDTEGNAAEYFFKTCHIPNTLSYCNGIIPCGDVKYLVK
jgi:hypothetical protein